MSKYSHHPLNRFRLRGFVTWCLACPGWFRIGRLILRWEVQ